MRCKKVNAYGGFRCGDGLFCIALDLVCLVAHECGLNNQSLPLTQATEFSKIAALSNMFDIKTK